MVKVLIQIFGLCGSPLNLIAIALDIESYSGLCSGIGTGGSGQQQRSTWVCESVVPVGGYTNIQLESLYCK